MFSGTFFLFQKEAFLARSCLLTGLTALRKANLSDRGQFYTASFQLSIGLERILKLILILDHMIDNNLEPEQSIIKNYRHDLVKLFQTSRAIGSRRNLLFLDSLDMRGMEYRLLSFLGKFAKSTRYFNLDSLSSGIEKEDPLADWNDILNDIIRNDLPEKRRLRILAESNALAERLGNHTISLSLNHDLVSRRLSLEEALCVPRLQQVAVSYSIYHVLKMLGPITQLLCALSDSVARANLQIAPNTCHVPRMDEFFQFVWLEKEFVLRKRRWP